MTSGRLDARLAAPALLCWLSTWWCLGGGPARAWWTAGACCALAIGLAVAVGRFGPAAGVAFLLAAAIAVESGLLLHRIRDGPVAQLAATRAEASLSLVVTGDPVTVRSRRPGFALGQDYVIVPARVTALSADGRRWRLSAPVDVVARDPAWSRLLPSQRLTASARLTPGERLVAARAQAHGPPRGKGPPSSLQRFAGVIRAGLRDASAVLPRDAGGLLPGLVVGDVSRLPGGVDDDFKATGLTHLTAVSGTNVSLLLGVVLALFRWLGAGRRSRTLAGAVTLALFVVVARPSASVLRAAAMGAVGLLALAGGRRHAAFPALCAAVLVLLFAEPGLARSYGFALSVLATVGLVLLAPAWRDRWARRLPLWLAEALAIPAAAAVTTAPVIVLLAAQVSLVTVPANLLAEPAVGPATVLGVLAAACAPVAMPLARVFAWLGGWPCRWLLAVAHVGARLPAAVIAWPAGWHGALLLAVVLAVTVALVPRLSRPGPVRRGAAAALAGLAVGFPTAHLTSAPWPPPGWRLVVCDVGQGDGLVLPAGAGTAVVVDVGPDPASMKRCLDDLGIEAVALVVLTHLHADHVEGLPAVLAGRRVGAIEIGPLDEPAGELARVRRWAAGAGVPVERVVDGEQRRVGALSWQVVAPEAAFHGTDSDPNNSSIVLRVSSGGLLLLLTGDIEPEAQDALLAGGVDVRADVLKIPHHGSAHQDPRFLRAVGARVAIASVGADNPYGHPAARTLGLLSDAGATVVRTDRAGDVALTGPAGGVHVVTHRHGAITRAGPGAAHNLTEALPGPPGAVECWAGACSAARDRGRRAGAAPGAPRAGGGDRPSPRGGRVRGRGLRGRHRRGGGGHAGRSGHRTVPVAVRGPPGGAGPRRGVAARRGGRRAAGLCRRAGARCRARRRLPGRQRRQAVPGRAREGPVGTAGRLPQGDQGIGTARVRARRVPRRRPPGRRGRGPRPDRRRGR